MKYSVFLKHTFLNPENEDFLSNKVWMMFPQHDLITASRQSLMECNATNMLSSPWRVSTFWIISSKWDSIVRATLNTVSRVCSLSWQHVNIGYSLFSISSAIKKKIHTIQLIFIFFLNKTEWCFNDIFFDWSRIQNYIKICEKLKDKKITTSCNFINKKTPFFGYAISCK